MKKRRITVLGLVLVMLISFGAQAAETKKGGEAYPYSANIKDAIWFGDLGTFHATALDESEFVKEDLEPYDVVIINFWATWCGPCLQEMPELAELEKTLPENVKLITCCIDYGSYDEVEEINETVGYEGMTLTGISGDLEKIARMIQYIPTTLFFDAEGMAVGSGMIGAAEDVKAAYLDAVNGILDAMGKPEITLAEAETETEENL